MDLDDIFDEQPAPLYAVTFDLTVRESAVVGRAAEVVGEARDALIPFGGDRKPLEDVASASGSGYAPYGRWSQNWDRGGGTRLAETLAQRVGGDAGWLVAYREATVGEVAGISVRLQELSPAWLGLRIQALWYGHRHADAPRGLIDAMEDLFVRLAGSMDATFGAAVPGEPRHRTELETKFVVDLASALEQSPEVLRGYSWITYLPPGVVDQLGGTEAVLAWEGFYRLRPVEGGGVVVRATADYDGYDPAAIRRVFDAVRTVLPAPGAPPRPKFIPEGWRHDLVWADEI